MICGHQQFEDEDARRRKGEEHTPALEGQKPGSGNEEHQMLQKGGDVEASSAEQDVVLASRNGNGKKGRKSSFTSGVLVKFASIASACGASKWQEKALMEQEYLDLANHQAKCIELNDSTNSADELHLRRGLEDSSKNIACNAPSDSLVTQQATIDLQQATVPLQHSDSGYASGEETTVSCSGETIATFAETVPLLDGNTSERQADFDLDVPHASATEAPTTNGYRPNMFDHVHRKDASSTFVCAAQRAQLGVPHATADVRYRNSDHASEHDMEVQSEKSQQEPLHDWALVETPVDYTTNSERLVRDLLFAIDQQPVSNQRQAEPAWLAQLSSLVARWKNVYADVCQNDVIAKDQRAPPTTLDKSMAELTLEVEDSSVIFTLGELQEKRYAALSPVAVSLDSMSV